MVLASMACAPVAHVPTDLAPEVLVLVARVPTDHVLRALPFLPQQNNSIYAIQLFTKPITQTTQWHKNKNATG